MKNHEENYLEDGTCAFYLGSVLISSFSSFFPWSLKQWIKIIHQIIISVESKVLEVGNDNDKWQMKRSKQKTLYS